MSVVFPLQSMLLNPFSSESSCCSMDWKETPEAHVFKFDLPGLTKEDVKLQIHDNQVLHISADRKDEDDQETSESDDQKRGGGRGGEYKWHCKERICGASFQREFRLPEDALVDQIKASMSDGVLVVTVPKDHHLKKKKLKHRAVEISGVDGRNDASSPKGFGRVECRNKDSQKILFSQEGITDSTAKYRIVIKEDHADELCDVKLISSSEHDCATPDPGRDRSRISITTHNAMISKYRFANALGFLMKYPISVVRKAKEKDLDGWPGRNFGFCGLFLVVLSIVLAYFCLC